MSNIGTSTCTLTVTRSIRRIIQSGGPNYWRNAVAVTLSGFDRTKTADANLALFLFNRGVLVATGGTMAASGANAIGTIDMNWTTMQTAMQGKEGDEIESLIMRLYDASTKEKISEGIFALRGNGREYDADGGATPGTPIPGSGDYWIGNQMFVVSGVLYAFNATDGLGYPMTFQGAGGTIHINWEETGVTPPAH